MKPTVYLDSSVPSYQLPQERDDPIVVARHLITVKWWEAHLANASKRTHLETLNRRLHLASPVICSPE